MKILSIGTDRLLFKTGSEVRRRILDYGELFDELHVIVFAKSDLGLKNEQLTDNVFLYPTQSITKINYIFDALKIGYRILKKDRNNWVITSQDPFETGLIAWLLKNWFKVTWQAQVHTDFNSPFFKKESFLNRLRSWFGRLLLVRADKIRVVSERIKKTIIPWPLKSEPVVLPIFVPQPLLEKTCPLEQNLHAKYPQFSFIILMASRLTKEKNYPLALGAFAEAVAHRPGVGLIIVGDGPQKDELLRLAKALGIEKQVIFGDWSCDLSCYYQTADLFMLTSNYEGYGRTLVEAGLNICPVLTTEVGLVGEIIDNNNALICPVGDEDCLVEKISWAVSRSDELRALVKKLNSDLATKLVEKNKYLDLYRQILC